MDVKFVTKNFSSNAGVESLIRKELARVEQMFADDTIFDVCIKKYKNKADKDFFKCDITIKNGRQFVRGYGEGDTVAAVIDFAVDSLKRKARKIKTAEIKKRKEYGKFIANSFADETDNSAELNLSITRVKEIEADFMSREEAIIQMELSGHDFFVFKDENGVVNVLYKRDQGYGLIVVG